MCVLSCTIYHSTHVLLGVNITLNGKGNQVWNWIDNILKSEAPGTECKVAKILNYNPNSFTSMHFNQIFFCDN